MSLKDVAAFLLGEVPLDGFWFGDPHPHGERYWWRKHLRAALAEGDPWKTAVLDALVVNWTLTAEHENDPRKAVADLIAAEVRIALDPLVSSEAQALIDRGKAESAGAEPVAWTTDYEIEGLRDGFVQQLTGRSMRLEPLFPAHQVKYLYTHPPAREAESVVNQQLTTELSDEEILSVWRQTVEGLPDRIDFITLPRVRYDELIAMARRYQWLCEDHADASTRERRLEILERMSVRSESANSAAIDAAMQERKP